MYFVSGKWNELNWFVAATSMRMYVEMREVEFARAGKFFDVLVCWRLGEIARVDDSEVT